MIDVAEKIKVSIQETLSEMSLVLAAVELDASSLFGDYSTNVAMHLAKQQKANPVVLAKDIVKKIHDKNLPYIEKIEVAGPGFINFYVKDNYLLSQLSLPHFKKTGKKIIIEYMQPNTNKPLHVGHLRNATLGLAVINMLREVGNDVKAATINNDRGLHIIKSMWAYLMLGKKEPTQAKTWQETIKEWIKSPKDWKMPSDMEEKRVQKGDHFVGYWYTLADTHYEEEQETKDAMQAMLVAWENKQDSYHSQVRALWKQLNDWFYEGAFKTYKVLGVTFDEDQINYESEIYEAGKQIILNHIDGKFFVRLPDGAVQAKLEEKFHLPDKILLRKDGTGIYMTFDIEQTRLRTLQNADKLVWVVGNDQDLYFKQLFAVCELLGYGMASSFFHFSYGMVKLPTGKMSSRKGTVVYGDDVLDMGIKRAIEVMNEAGVAKNLESDLRQEVAQQVGIGAVKYTLLSYDPKSEIAFDIKKSVTFEGNSGPYLQYSLARANSVIQKIQKHEEKSVELSESEKKLLHILAAFDEVLLKSANEYAPHQLTTYLIRLAQEFNTMYATSRPILGITIRENLTKAFCETMKKGLTLLGIATPQHM